MGPLYFFSRNEPIQKLITSWLSTLRRLVLLLDYDGTLVPIRKDPARAVLSNGMTEMLELLLQNRRISLGVVTGRSLSNIRQLVRLKGIFFIANHGFESLVGTKTWIHPNAKRCVPLINKAFHSLERSLRSIQGVFIEHKQYTLTVHYRNTPARKAPFVRKVVKDVVSMYPQVLTTTAGKKILEIRPQFPWGKGRGISRILCRMAIGQNPKVIYLGDDVTDEDAFRALRKDALTVKVGWSRNTKARYFVRNIAEVKKLLKAIAFV